MTIQESRPDTQLKPPEPPSFGFLSDVNLDATIRFGTRELSLKDIFALGPGSIVELDQALTAPADLLIAGRLVARGEVVVVDGMFGLQVQEVISTSQRAELCKL
jgi:flagellar motor switch protein FliN